MAEHPIIFSTEMVRAILDGRKTQTRRVIKNVQKLEGLMLKGEASQWCPYGKVGDTLWVRESLYCDVKAHFGRYKVDDKPVSGELPLVWCWKTKHLSGRFMPKHLARIFLEITNIRVERVQDISEEDAKKEGVEEIWHNHRPMYKNYFAVDYSYYQYLIKATESFEGLWDSINAKRYETIYDGEGNKTKRLLNYGWDKNPFVWVIEFKRK